MREDLTGQKFRALTVLEPAGVDKALCSLWLVRCDCGREKVITTGNLKKAKTCGACLVKPGRGSKLGAPQTRKHKGEMSSFYLILGQYKHKAKKRGLVWELDDQEALHLMHSPCYYCGSAPSQVGQRLKHLNTYAPFVYNGIDRRDSSRGYTLDNVVACCGFCNRAKLDKPEAEFREWLIRVAMYYGGTL